MPDQLRISENTEETIESSPSIGEDAPSGKDCRFVVLIPSVRPAEASRLIERMDWPGAVIVGASGATPVDSFEIPEREALRVRIESVPIGYASARNALLDIARKAGYSHGIFVDDDIEFVSGGLSELLRTARRFPEAFVGGKVRRRVENQGALARNVLPGSFALAGTSPASLSANVLVLPLSVESTETRFSVLLDFTGGEDTELTRRAGRQGVALLQTEDIIAEEVYGSTRGSTHALVRRLICNHAVLGLIRDRRTENLVLASRAVNPSRVGGLLYHSAAIAATLSARFSPSLALSLAKAAGYGLAKLQLLPTRLNKRYETCSVEFLGGSR
ncbi:hypothetical protein [Kineosporia sp. NBRC 101731]|uniref:hypothetical protein n=1 Tax=Kineosporia sp. NBRC 101731 TaxID=3032199 RepID=UPI002552E66B|nr:hypothetical protein [Kineosporia sp. NBRC 101731]